MGDDSSIMMEVLGKATDGKIDEVTLEYMAGMIKEEGISKMSVAKLIDLIGPFLIDYGCADDEKQAGVLCEEIFSKVKGTKNKVKSSANDDKREAQCNNNGGYCNNNHETNSTNNNNSQDDHEGEDDLSDGGDEDNKVMLATPILMGDLCKSGQSSEFSDPFLGLKEVNVNYNTSLPISEVLKMQKQLQREREKQLRLMKEWEKQKAPLPMPKKRHGDKQLSKITDIIVDSFSVSVAGRELLKDAQLKLVIGRRYGLVGRNGIGKSTFLGALARHEIPGVKSDISVGCVEQEIEWGDETAFEAVLAVDVERKELLEEEALLQQKEQTDQVAKRLAMIYQRLQDIEANNAESQVATILSGLGFSEAMMHTRVRQLSGGWRMRVALSRALFADPDVLLLDEPTNHLDLHAVAWLASYLINWSKTIIIVSHARHFLNEVCTDMLHFIDQSLHYYRCNYDQFEGVRAERLAVQQKQFEAQEAKKQHMQQFIDKFRYNAKRAALVQSRIKALSKLPLLEAVSNDPSLCFNFVEPEKLPTPMLQLQSVSFTYDAENYKNGKLDSVKWILKNVDLSIDLESRVAICGVNGSGKSTLLNILIGELEPTQGMCLRHGKLRIGYFAQHHIDQLDLTLNAVQQLQARYPEANLKDEQARSYLGGFGICGLLALEPLYILSGGQKSRVAIALVAFKQPHILVLDEPTNHLDLDAIQALITALNEFQGGVVLVSHDAHMLSCVVEEVWHVEPTDMSCTKFHSDFNAYKKQLLKKSIKA